MNFKRKSEHLAYQRWLFWGMFFLLMIGSFWFLVGRADPIPHVHEPLPPNMVAERQGALALLSELTFVASLEGDQDLEQSLMETWMQSWDPLLEKYTDLIARASNSLLADSQSETRETNILPLSTYY